MWSPVLAKGSVQAIQPGEGRAEGSEGGPWGLGNWVREGFPEAGVSGRRADKMWHVTREGEGSGWGLLAKPWGPRLLSPVPHAWGGPNPTPCAGPQRP